MISLIFKCVWRTVSWRIVVIKTTEENRTEEPDQFLLQLFYIFIFYLVSLKTTQSFLWFYFFLTFLRNLFVCCFCVNLNYFISYHVQIFIHGWTHRTWVSLINLTSHETIIPNQLFVRRNVSMYWTVCCVYRLTTVLPDYYHIWNSITDQSTWLICRFISVPVTNSSIFSFLCT